MLLLVGLLVGPSGADAQDAAKGAALLAEARAALGEDDKLRSVKTLDVKGDFKRSAGRFNLEGELRVRLETPDKLRRDEDMSQPGGGPSISRTEVLNGATVWDEGGGGIRGGGIGGRFTRERRDGGPDLPGGGRARLDPAQRENLQRRGRQADLARLMLAWLLTADGEVVWVGTAESPDGTADVLEVTPPNAPAMRLFLDSSAHLPLMITWQGAAPRAVLRRGGRRGGGDDPGPGGRPDGGGPSEATLRMTLGDYKMVNGVRLPHFMTRGLNGRTIEEWTVDSYRLNPSFRADVFTK
jgi:hypothetical protein